MEQDRHAMIQRIHIHPEVSTAVAQTMSRTARAGEDAGYITIKIDSIILETGAEQRVALDQEELSPRIITNKVEDSRRPRIVPAQDRCLILVFMVGHIWTSGQVILLDLGRNPNIRLPSFLSMGMRARRRSQRYELQK